MRYVAEAPGMWLLVMIRSVSNQHKEGVLLCADNGRDEHLGYAIAFALRLMNGKRAYSQLVRELADNCRMDNEDATVAIEAIVYQFVQEGVIELSATPQKGRDFPPPLSSEYHLKILQLQLTNRCNLACAHCYAESGKPLSCEMSAGTLCSLIDAFANLGGCRLFLTGGESLLCNHLYKVIRFAKSRHLFVYLSTNGYAITDKKADELIALGVGAVNVSIDGDNADTHDKFRGKKNSYVQAKRALELFAKRGILCGSQTTIFKGNLGQSVNIYDEMQSLGVRSCFFVRMMPQGRGSENSMLIPTLEEYAAERRKEYTNRRVRYGKDLYPKKVVRGGQPHRCSAGINQMYVRADGNCYPCPSLELPGLCMGNFPSNSLVEIWNGQNAELCELRRFDPFSISECVACEHLRYCKGGCAGNAFYATGNWRNPDPHFCITMNIRKEVQSIEL